MERAERRSRAVFARPALTAPHLHLPARISNRQFLARLENAATRRKQTPEADSNRHFWQGGPPIMQCLGYAEAGNFRCLAGRQISNRQWAGGAPFAAGRVIFFGWRVAHRVVSSNSIYYYIEDMLGSSHALATSAGTLCYDADFYPYGGEHDYVNTCAQNYKFTGEERDPETNNDDFDARYYSSAYGRFLSADWSSTPTPVPYANLTNPQTLNLYAMVSDNPESFADLDGHKLELQSNTVACATGGSESCDAQQAAAQNSGTAQNKVQVQATVIDQGKIVQGEKQADGTSVTGVRGIIQDTITVNGKPLSGVEVNETNVSTVTVNGKPMFPQEKPGSATTNNAGQINDTVGLLAPARTAAQDKALTEGLRTQAVTVTNTNTITFAIPGSSKYTATSTRTLTNVGSDGRVGSTYTLSKTDPVVRAVP
jgi:RHS repeat-associated protein